MSLRDILGELKADQMYAGGDIVDFLIPLSLFHNLVVSPTHLRRCVRLTDQTEILRNERKLDDLQCLYKYGSQVLLDCADVSWIKYISSFGLLVGC